jgi:hypothetical protein
MKTFTLLCLISTVLCADTRLEDSERGDLRKVVIRISEGAFTLEHLEELAQIELTRAPRVSLTSLTMIGSQAGFPLPKPDHYGFQTWLNIYNIKSEPNEIAEMVAIGQDAVLRVSDRNGTLTERILSGKNPLRIAVEGRDFQIVYVATDIPVGKYVRYREDIRFFIRTVSPLRVDTEEELFRMLQVVLPNVRVIMNVQNDGLFIDSPDYPFLNPFVRIERPPTREEYLRTKTLRCDNAIGPPWCKIQ